MTHGRIAKATLVAELAGGRTVLQHQHVGYPLHVTRPFALDRGCPTLSTLYLQSASGGLYAGDDIAIDLTVGADAALNLTTSTSTVVHDGREVGSVQRQSIKIGLNGFCAVISDPFILFPKANLFITTTATLADRAVLILADGFTTHDPRFLNEPFDRFATDTNIQCPDGRVFLTDRGGVSGSELTGSLGPLGGHRAVATILVIAPPDRRPDIDNLESASEQCGCTAGATVAPNSAGLAMRLLAPDGGTLARGIEAAFHVASKAALGMELERRRK